MDRVWSSLGVDLETRARPRVAPSNLHWTTPVWSNAYAHVRGTMDDDSKFTWDDGDLVFNAYTEQPVEHLDVVILGAGISGIDAAYHLKTRRPQDRFAVLEALSDFGGTWRIHTYPGVRSDSDLYTFGFGWKPWTGVPIATAGEILDYLGEAIEEQGLGGHLRFNHHLERADWSTTEQRWHLAGTRGDGEPFAMTCGFLWMCQGYYHLDHGYTPDWEGFNHYQGQVIHPQRWPEDVDLSGKQVVVIGSGATAATLVPAIAEEAGHVTVLQRSPTYFWPGPNLNELAEMLRPLDLDPALVHDIVRKKVLYDQQMVTELCFSEPEFAKQALLEMLTPLLPEGYDIATHFTPRYDPWRQRIARIPDGDLFQGICRGLVTMVTDEIDHFTEGSIVTKGGQELTCDVVITATGFDLCVLGDVAFSIDGEPIDVSQSVTYRGLMFTGIPNMAWVFGYFRASWTLRADLVSEFLIRLLDHLEAQGLHSATPALREADAEMAVGPWVDPADFNPGYLQRSMALMPKSGDKPEWRHSQDYWTEAQLFPSADLDDGCLQYR